MAQFWKAAGQYGTAGNDLIGDYQFLDTWSSSSANYQGVQVLLPRALYNPQLAWEINKKAEAAIDLEFLQGRIQFSAAHYRNRSGNQLISYSLPFQTGFNTIKKNLDAVVQNTGYEFSLQSYNIRKRSFYWMTSANLSMQKNKLVQFPGLSTSSYASQFVTGEPISIVKVYQYTGVDPTSGLYTFFDADRSGSLNTADRILLKNTQPKYYGGLQNIINYKEIELSVFFQFIKQTGLNYLYTISSFTPGHRFVNQPSIVLNRWRQAGDISDIQKFTTQQSGALNQSDNLVSSDAVYSDASFIRLKNVSLSYTLSQPVLKRIKAESLKFYIHGQNLWTITDYLGADPENQSIYRMPPLRTVAVGVQLNF